MFLSRILSVAFRRSKQPNTKLREKKDVDEDEVDRDKSLFMIKKPGPCHSLKHCIFTWNEEISTFYLYENPNPSSTTVEKGKFLLAARKFKYPSHIEYVMSLDAYDFSKESDFYVGKLSSDYHGINFTIYENGALPNNAATTKQIGPVLANNFKVGQICYEFNELQSKGPRHFVSSIKCPSGSVNSKKNKASRNKTLKWHEDLQCLCFQSKYRVWGYVAAGEKCQTLAKIGDKENIHFGSKWVAADTAVLFYRQPYSALHAFAIRIAAQDHILCLSS